LLNNIKQIPFKMYLMAIVSNAIIFNMFKPYYYYHANIHLRVIVFKLYIYILGQIDPWVTRGQTMGFFSLSKGATTSLKLVYKCCG
jgi:hypothetical protein